MPSPSLSTVVAALAPSPTIALNNKAKALTAKGTKVYNFSVGEPDYPSPSLAIETAITSLKNGRTKYGPPGGGLPLRQAIVAKLARDNELSYQPQNIVVGIGAKEILFHVFLSILNEGDEVIIPAPYWVSYTSQVECCRARTVILPLPADPTAPRLTPAMIEAALTPKSKAIVLNSPNNPAGYVYTEAELRSLGAYLESKQLWIVSDEIYEYMSFSSPHKSLLQMFPSLKDRFILINGLSKAYAMTGWRVGYCAAPAAVAELVANLQSQTSTCLPGFIEDAATAVLGQGRELMESQVAMLNKRRVLAVESLKQIPNLKTLPTEGAFYVYIDIRPLLAASKKFKADDSLSFSAYLLETFQVAMVPGEAFGTPGFLRLSYAVADAELSEGIKRLGQALASLN